MDALAIGLIVAAAVVFGVVGFILGGIHRKKVAEAAIGSATEEANRIVSQAVSEAESKKKEAILEAKDEIHKQRIYRKEMSVLLGTYARCGRDAKRYKSDILELGKEMDAKKCDIPIKGLYYLFRVSPGLFKGVYLSLLYSKRCVCRVMDKSAALGRKR